MMGVIRYFIYHRTAVNLLMLFVITAGVASLLNINIQLWPTYEIRKISVQITWAGASADAVDRLIAKPLDQKLNTLNGTKNVNTYSYLGSVYSSIEFDEQKNMEAALAEVQNKISSISTFPSNTNSPVITLTQPLEHVTRILVYGDFSNRVAIQLSETLTDALEAEGIKNIRVRGLKHPVIYVNVDPLLAREYGLNPVSIAKSVKSSIQHGFGGAYQEGNSTFNTKVTKTDGLNSLGDILLEQNRQIFPLSDIANISRDFPEQTFGSVYPGGNGFFLQILRNTDEDSIKATQKVQNAMDKLRLEISPSVTMMLYDTRANQISERLWLLFKNSMFGLLLVAGTLFVFLNSRAAFWVVAGIPVAFAATFCLMWLTGQTINMVSAFAMVMVLGIIVDDAIVVAENIATKQSKGREPLKDTYRATRMMWRPVLTATLTTVAAFAPIMFLTDVFGSYVKAIPYFVCAALAASLVECFILLPGHMRGGDNGQNKKFFLRSKIDSWVDWITEKPFKTFITHIYENRLLPALILLGFLGFAAGLAATNSVRFQFWLNPESNFLYANATIIPGVDGEARKQVINELWAALEKAEEKTGYTSGELTRATFALEGYHFSSGNQPADPSRVAVFLELAAPNGQRIPASQFAKTWRASMPQSSYLQSIEISPNRAGPSGSDIHVELKAKDLDQLETAVLQIEQALSRIEGVQQISNTLAGEQPEALLNLRSEGLEAGLTSRDVSSQLFAAIAGIKAHHIEDEGQSLDVRVRYARGGSFDAILDIIPITLPDGQARSVRTIADISYGYGKTQITRQNGEISASVKANVDREVVDASAVWRELDRSTILKLQADTGVKFTHKGKRKERSQAFKEITLSLLFGTIAIYCILAWSMESMWWPLAVMAVLPLGSAGAILGHYVMDYKISMLSLVSVVALFGILVNDSIILFEEIRYRNSIGQDWKTATIAGYMSRLRPVLLTTITTIVGLAPLILEQSYQAQFLIPIAITITWGLAAATMGSFLLVPIMTKLIK